MKAWFSDTINQLFTILGMYATWMMMDGTAKVVFGYLLIATIVVWWITFSLRNPKE